MRTFTISCLAILLLSVFASARLGDTAVTASMPTSNTTAVPSAADVNNFLSGVWEAIGLGHDFDDFSTCVQEGNNAGTQLQKAMTMMNSSSAPDVSNGLNKLDKVVQPLVAGLKSCNMNDKYTKTINQIINKFTGADQLNIITGSSILINGVEVYSDVAAAINACNKSNYISCGSSIGNAMGRVFYSSENVTSSEVADEINTTPNITWTAADISEFYGLNLWQFKKSRLTLRRKKNASANSSDSSVEEDNRRNLATIPTTFDARNNWPNCIHPIRDQMNCGSCWAFGASEVLSDRFCIASNQSINTVMSPQYLVSCDSRESACNGGYINHAWKFLETSGDVSDSCWPYQSGNNVVPSCSTFTKCKDSSQIHKYYAKVNSSKSFTTPTAIQNEIITNGPVEAGMDVYSDFMNYRSGVYSTTSRATYLGGHAVKIVGWGISNGINYWIVANSWGTYWGESGFFRIKFGSCSIDRGCYAGLPDLSRS